MRKIWSDPSDVDYSGCISAVELIMEIVLFFNWNVNECAWFKTAAEYNAFPVMISRSLKARECEIYTVLPPRFIANRLMRTTVPLTAKPVQYITISTLANNHAPDIWARWHSISHVVTAKWKYGGSNMTRTVYRSWAHWVQLDTQSDFPHRWHKQLVTNAFWGRALTQYGWVPAVSRPARGTRDAAALRWGRSLEIYWLRGSAFWPETSVRRAGHTNRVLSCHRVWE